MTETLIE